MKRWQILAALLALVLILSAGIRGASAYFTTYIIVEGGVPVRLGGGTDVDENVSDWTKQLTVTNSDPGEAVFVRARAFCGSLITLTYSDANGQWTDGGDGWWYHEGVLAPGETAPTLLVHIGNLPETPADGDDFHVIVVYETTPVLYHEDGTPYADWSLALSTTEGGETP